MNAVLETRTKLEGSDQNDNPDRHGGGWSGVGHNKEGGQVLVTTRRVVRCWLQQGGWSGVGYNKEGGQMLVTTRSVVRCWLQQGGWSGVVYNNAIAILFDR